MQYIACKMLSFPILEIQIQTQTQLEKEAWKQAKQIHIVWSKVLKKLSKWGSRNLLQNNKNASLHFKVSFPVLPNDQGSPQGPPARSSEATKHAKQEVVVPGMPRNRPQRRPKIIKK